MNNKKISLLLLMLFVQTFAENGAFISTLNNVIPLEDAIKKAVYSLSSLGSRSMNTYKQHSGRPLFSAYPKLKSTVSCVQLGLLPTPVSRLTQLENHYSNSVKLFVKDDGLTGGKKGICSFGGNKIRKLEFLLADALSKGAACVMTFGAIGSNHVVATSAACKYVGLRCIAQLKPQDVSEVVKRNMRLMHQNDVDMILSPNNQMRSMQAICSFVQEKYQHNAFPYVIPTGGSNEIGALGFVNAAFELKAQIKNGELSEPDFIYVATGSCGTIAGLTVGLRAAGLKTKALGVIVEPDTDNQFVSTTFQLVQALNRSLHEKDPSFPHYDWTEDDIHLISGFSGPDYGIVTHETVTAIETFKSIERIQLDTTYSGKAAAALLDHIKSGKLDGKTVLFWKTFCSDIAEPSVHSDRLPLAFRQFFRPEEPNAGNQ